MISVAEIDSHDRSNDAYAYANPSNPGEWIGQQKSVLSVVWLLCLLSPDIVLCFGRPKPSAEVIPNSNVSPAF